VRQRVAETGSDICIGADRVPVLTYLRRRGFRLPDDTTTTVLGGGVSNVVLAVSGGTDHLVIKMPLARLRVADDWHAPIDRMLAERDALRIAARLTPAAVPAVRDCDEQEYVLVIDRAPASWQNWKELLLAGDVGPGIATQLGEVLATWHGLTADGRLATPALHRTDIFSALRLDPYYLAAAERLPEFSAEITACARSVAARHACLVHGDFSPKNILVGPPGQLWIVDFEVACWGDPAFDLAFMMTHLLLKSVHRPGAAAAYDTALTGFCAAYQAAVSGSLRPDWSYVIRQTACLLIARVLGKSPAEYLSGGQQRLALGLGTSLLSRRPAGIEEVLAVRGSACDA
jgi:aminoglycoside phosphotransferase (APT) family kinase protein